MAMSFCGWSQESPGLGWTLSIKLWEVWSHGNIIAPVEKGVRERLESGVLAWISHA